MALDLSRPKSIKILTASSIIATNEDKAANVSPKNNKPIKKLPAGILLKSIGIHINVNPIFPEPTASNASCSGSIAKTVHKIAIADKSDAELLPSPVKKEFKTTSSFFLI